MARADIINYKGRDIFYMDFSNLKTKEEINAVMVESVNFIRNKPEKSITALTNMTNMHFNNEVKDLFSDFLKGNKPHIKISSVFGMSGLARILFNGLMKITGRDVRSFEKETEAKDFLISNS
ncbi:MAG: hypothetical protein JXR51_16885 [Bacteroidales bacterium]|nr:hypothetical protein [Bacteroidales bacterium]MBN2758845.1 hypothetical protein [Bacteroidales bacterium]